MIEHNLKISLLLEEFINLPNNWDEEGAIAPSKEVIMQAYSLYQLLESYSEPIFHTAPGPWGEIMLELRDEQTQRSVEFIFYTDRQIYVTSDYNREAKQGAFSILLIPSLLQWLHQKPDK